MKRKLFTLLVALIASAGTINAKKVVFDFTNPESLGITAPEAGKGTPLNDSIIIVNGVTMTNKKVHPTDAQIWYAGGEYSFRTYKTSTLTFKADDYISAIEFDGISVLFNEIEFGKVWVGNTDSITFTATGRCIISKITLTVGEPANAWIPDTVTVAQARALIEANDTLDHFVKGIVASQPFNTYNAFSGRVNFYMVDDLAATDSLLACQVHAGQQLNASLLKLVGWASLEAAWEELRIGDTILVYANALNLNATNIYQIESGFYDSKLGANPNPPAIEYPVYDTITVAEAMEIGKALADNAETTEEYVVYGYAGTAYEPKEGYKDQTWYMADEPDVYSEFQAYRCTPDTLVVKGDFMYVKGKLKKYVKDTKVTIEICYGTAVHGEAPAPVELEPITVAQALEIAQALTPEKGKSLSTDEKYAVLGYVVSISQKYANTYYIADAVGVLGEFQAYKCASVDREVAEGDRVIVTGYIMNYYGEGSSGEYHNYEISGGTLIHAIIASDKQVDGIWYILNNIDNTASVTYKGDNYFSYTNEYSGSITIPASISYNGKTYRVTNIGDYAFANCTRLTSVTIPNSVTSIGNYAFSGCTGLTSVTIPDSVTSIGLSAFNGCSGLTSVTIPESVESINMGGTFQNCTSLKEVYWNAINCKIEPYNDGGNYYPPFNNLSNITNFTFGDKVQKIPACLCYSLSGLTSIEIPNNVTSIGIGAFYGCSGLTSLTIPNSVTSIGLGAFNGCSGLTSVTISESVESINMGGTFLNCTSLKEVNWNAINCKIEPYNDEGSYSPPFNNLSNITNFTFGDKVQKIPACLCCSLSGLTSIEIPNNVTSIGDYAFANCKNLNKVTILADIPPTLKTGVFKNAASDLSIYVPCGTFETYQSAWSEYSDKINYPKLEYTITGKTNNEAAGQVIVPQTMCDSSITAMPNNGYYFVKWSDGNTDNPRTIVLTQDTTFTAEFAISKSGVCGANNALTWSWDDTSKTLTISENGALTENYTFGLEAPTQLQKLVVGNEVTAIGDSAFYGMKTLTRMTLGNGLESIGNCAFMNCSKLTEAVIPSSVMTIGKGAFMNGNRLQKITLGANIETIDASAFANCPYLLEVQAKMEFPPIIDASVFADCGELGGIDCYVPEESIALYKKTAVWKEFHLLATPAETPTALEQVGNKASTMVQKILRDGQILILRGDRTYTITGQEVR